MFRGRVVDISPDNMMIEICRPENEDRGVHRADAPYGILELARTGRIALVRGRPRAGRRHERARFYASRPPKPEVLAVLEKLQPGQRINITQIVRVGIQDLAGRRHRRLSPRRFLGDRPGDRAYAPDDIIVPVVHFTKDNQEMSSIAVDEHTKIEIVPNQNV